MAEKIKKHPSIFKTSDNVLSQHGLTVSGGVETLTILLSTKQLDMAINYINLMNEKEKCEKEIKQKQKEIKECQSKLQNINVELEKMNEIRDNYDIIKTDAFKSALERANLLLSVPEAQYQKTKVTRIKKIELQELIDIADEFCVPFDLLMEHLDQDLIRKYVKHGEFLNICRDTSATKSKK